MQGTIMTVFVTETHQFIEENVYKDLMEQQSVICRESYNFLPTRKSVSLHTETGSCRIVVRRKTKSLDLQNSREQLFAVVSPLLTWLEFPIGTVWNHVS